MKYYGTLTAKGTGFLLGGVKTHRSSLFNTRDEAMNWLAAAVEINEQAGRKVDRYWLSTTTPKTKSKKNAGTGKGFTFHGSFTSKILAQRKERATPGSFIQEKGGRYYVLKPKRIATRRNPHFIKTGSKELKVTQTKIDSWSGRTMYYAGLQWWWEVSPGRFMPETYLGEKRSKRRGKLVEHNPSGTRKGLVKIYDRVTRIECTKGSDSLFPGQKFFHNFKSPYPAMYGTADRKTLIIK